MKQKSVLKSGLTLHTVLQHNSQLLGYLFNGDLLDFFEVCLLAKMSGLIHGKGGTGKTDMLNMCLRTIAGSTADYRQVDCHSAMSPATLLGGAAAETKYYEEVDEETGEVVKFEITSQTIDYRRGPLNARFTLYDEGLDTPVATMAALKGVMTARAHDNWESAHDLFFMATNIDPASLIAEADSQKANSVAAFVHRWATMEFGLPDHEPETYLQAIDHFDQLLVSSPDDQEGEEFWYYDIDNMLETERARVLEVSFPKKYKELLSSLTSQSSKTNFVVNLREVRWVISMMKAHAYMRGRASINMEDFSVLQYFKAWAPSTYANLRKELELVQLRQDQADRLAEANEFIAKWAGLAVPEQFADKRSNFFYSLEKKADKYREDLAGGKWTDDFIPHRDMALTSLQQLAEQAAERKLPEFQTVEL